MVHGILQAIILEWVFFPFSRGSSQPRNRIGVSCIADEFFTNWSIREALICVASGKIKVVQTLWKMFLKKLFSIQLSNFTCSNLSKKNDKTGLHKNTCLSVHTSLFLIAPNWKQPSCPLLSGWIKKLWFIHIVQYYSGIKEMSYYAAKGHGGNLNAYYWVKEANLKKLLTVWFQVCDILKKAKLYRQ